MKTALAALALVAPTWLVAQERQGLPETDKPAPAIRLNDHEGKVVRAPDVEAGDWTVLAFFPKAMTPG